MHWNPLSRRTPIGIDVTPRFIHAAQLSGAGRGGYRLEAALSLPRGADADELTEDEVRNLAEALPRREFSGNTVVLCMPGDFVITEVFRTAELKSPNPESTEVGALIAKAHRCDAQSLECASWSLPAARPGGSPAGVMAVACRHEHAGPFLDAIERGHFEVCGLDVRCQALTRACETQIHDEEALSALVDLGWTSARLVVLCGSVVIFERTLGDCGLNRLEMTLTGRLGLEQDVAEYVLENIGLGGAGTATEIASSLLDEVHGHVESYVRRLISELKRSFSYAVQEYPDRSFSTVVLAGEGAVVPGICEPIGTALGVRALITTPCDLMESGPGLETIGRSPMLTVAAGLAMYDRG